MLLKKGAKETQDSTGLTPFDWAAAENNTDVMRVLYKANSNADRGLALILAASAGRLEACKVSFNLKRNSIILKLVVVLCTPQTLLLAHLQNFLNSFSFLQISISCFQLLLNLDPRYVEKTDTCGRTALHHAAHLGNAALSAVLLSTGADPSKKDDASVTPLMFAAGCSQSEAAEELVGWFHFFYTLIGC